MSPHTDSRTSQLSHWGTHSCKHQSHRSSTHLLAECLARWLSEWCSSWRAQYIGTQSSPEMGQGSQHHTATHINRQRIGTGTLWLAKCLARWLSEWCSFWRAQYIGTQSSLETGQGSQHHTAKHIKNQRNVSLKESLQLCFLFALHIGRLNGVTLSMHHALGLSQAHRWVQDLNIILQHTVIVSTLAVVHFG